MLRSRDSFFAQSSMNQQSYFPNQLMMQNPNPYQASGANNYFYSGPVPNGNGNGNYGYDDYENRIAKLERSINRLEARISKLENSANIISQDVSTSMYMV